MNSEVHYKVYFKNSQVEKIMVYITFLIQLNIFKTFLYQDDHQDDEFTPTFFEETTIYWEPGSDCSVIYQQLAQKKFREIVREQIE